MVGRSNNSNEITNPASNRPILLLQNEPLLTKAVLKKSLHLVKERILEGDDPLYKDIYKRTYLHLAAFLNSVELTEYFIEEGVEVDGCDLENLTPLHRACRNGCLDVVTCLLDHGANASSTAVYNVTPLHICAYYGHVNDTIDARNTFGQTALHMAVYLLNRGADPNIQDSEGNTCLHLALKRGIVELFKVFMSDPKTDPSIPDNEMNTVIHTAIKLGHTNLISQMLPSAKDLTVQDSEGCSILIRAIQHNLEELASNMLKACPALATCINHDLVTPLHLAAERGMKQLTHQLLIAGAQVTALDANGLTPSLYCAKNDEVLECLSMIEDMMINDAMDESRQRRSLKYEPKISS